jgi:CHRD domain-containing protein
MSSREVSMHIGRRLVLALVTGAVLAVVVAASSVGAAGGRTFDVMLSSAVEVPAPNDAATGTARLSINPGLKQVCYDISWESVAPGTGGITVQHSHIHIAPVGSPGPILVPLFMNLGSTAVNGSTSGCVTSDLTSSELAAILSKPGGYYVNVHSALNPPGAIRAQLDS